ncbi:MAG: sporulation protein [Deltaproteobacteria bacterium]|nr:sporulation protein [Deltaproteobacteria bacterium]
MASLAEELISRLISELGTLAKTETVVGKEFQAGEFTLIPVSKVSLGIGAGGGKGSESKKTGEGGGGGGGIAVTPIAFIAIRGSEISFHEIKKGGTMDAFFDQLPDIAEKILTKKGESETTEQS